MYSKIKDAFSEIIDSNNLWDEKIIVKAKVLTPNEAIGNPEREDFPLFKGKERIMQAEFKGSFGQAFTDMYGDYEGTLKGIMNMDLSNNYRRAIFVSTINAVMRYLNLIEGTTHCKNEDPELCAKDLVEFVKDKYGNLKIAFVGLQPALVENCSKFFETKVVDLDKDNVGKKKFGLTIQDGQKEIKEVLDWCDLAIVTGTAFVNNTATSIINLMKDKSILFYGVTVAGIAELLNLDRFCSRSK
jgi:uncharacterized protein (DUF4213/DUF364 family)